MGTDEMRRKTDGMRKEETGRGGEQRRGEESTG